MPGVRAERLTVLTAWTGTVLRALDDGGIDSRELAAKVGIDDELLDDPDQRVPLELSNRLWRAAVEAVGDDAFGIDVSRHVRHGSFHALGPAFLSSRTIRAALERSARFSRVTSSVAQGSTRIESAQFVFAIGWHDHAIRPAAEAVDAVLASIVRAVRYLHGPAVSPARVELERAAPQSVERFRSFFGCEVRFDTPENLLAFDLAIADRPVPGGNDRLASSGDEALADYLEALDASRAADLVRAVLVDAIAAGEPDVGAVAAELAMSARSLQRRLGEEGTTFRSVLAATRRDVADALLASGNNVTATALRLGFSETAAFSRAYRRWTGSSPSAMLRS